MLRPSFKSFKMSIPEKKMNGIGRTPELSSGSGGARHIPEFTRRPTTHSNNQSTKFNPRAGLKCPEIIINKSQNPKYRWGSYYNNMEQTCLCDKEDQFGGRVHVCTDKCKTLSTPLHEAAKQGNAEGLELLLANPSTDPNARDCLGRTALHYAVKGGLKSFELAELDF